MEMIMTEHGRRWTRFSADFYRPPDRVRLEIHYESSLCCAAGRPLTLRLPHTNFPRAGQKESLFLASRLDLNPFTRRFDCFNGNTTNHLAELVSFADSVKCLRNLSACPGTDHRFRSRRESRNEDISRTRQTAAAPDIVKSGERLKLLRSSCCCPLLGRRLEINPFHRTCLADEMEKERTRNETTR